VNITFIKMDSQDWTEGFLIRKWIIVFRIGGKARDG
jgi:hypothetical protein